MAPLKSWLSVLSKPNFVFILTDDQDLRLGSLDHQPLVKKHIAEQGTTFNKHYCTIALCCPSRVSLLTGKAAHNTNVTDVSQPYGGYPKFISEGLNDKYLPVWLQQAGYNTYYTGKLMNGFTISTFDSPSAAGWNGTDYLLDPQCYWYHNASMARNYGSPRYFPGNYSTDLVADAALGFLDEAIAADNPFFLGVAPIGPHAEMRPSLPNTFDLPVPADRHKYLFQDLKVPRSPSFNTLRTGGVNYLASLPELNETELAYLDLFYRRRIQSLQAVDELVEGLVNKLSEHPDVLTNTYVIYSSDNGYHIGQHRLPPGKTCNIEEDINVPFLVRGPGVAKNTSYNRPTTHTDIVPTIFQLAGISLHDDFDGEPIPVTIESQSKTTPKVEHVNVEFWGKGIAEGTISNWTSSFANNTYKHVRVVADDYDLSYTVWCTNEHELYDLKTDPYQSTNLYGSTDDVSGYSIDKLISRLDALLLTLKGCKGRVCTRPWETLHPQGNVRSLADALDSEYDHFYLSEQLKVSYSGCEAGYLTQFEGALSPLSYDNASSFPSNEQVTLRPYL
ncbi:arylsulfatase precursor [Whalleya microplaca]|nr:arylsulfatase precursor [Whalleya microplaca]